MLDLYYEFERLISAFNERHIEYSVCGGLAMAVHGAPRTTIDIDLLIPPESLDGAKTTAGELGYVIEAGPMSFRNGAVEIRRVSKLDPDSGDLLMLDMLLVTPEVAAAWQTRTEVEWEQGRLWIVSREGLIMLKSLRGSAQDLADIERLKEGSYEG
ncbi:MAG TPA: hypothetical protein VJH03_14345 [Blastocatellia bacterium]|nr:hypothetical protein [Blastocatellia bacterium]